MTRSGFCRLLPLVSAQLLMLVVVLTGTLLPSATAREPTTGRTSPADQITAMRRLDDTIIRRKDFTGDNWHTTWAADGHQYVLQCDGRGYNTRLWRLRGNPPDFTFEPVASHPGPQESDAEAKAG